MPSSTDSGSVSNFNIEDPNADTKRNKRLLWIGGIAAGVSALFLVIFLPIYFTVIEPDDNGVPVPPPIEVPNGARVNCYPDDPNVTPELCQARGCAWNVAEDENAPKCYYYGERLYSLSGDITEDSSGITSVLKTNNDKLSHFGKSFSQLTVKTTYISKTTLRVKIYPSSERFEVPMDHPESITKPSDALYVAHHVNNDNNEFGVRVEREGGTQGRVLFDTSVGEMMFADQYLQITTKVASEYVYGFGEQMHTSFKHNMNWKTYGMFSRDQGVGENVNLYGVHPYFMCMEGDGNAYGVYFVNSNAMDVTMQPDPAITYISTGGLMDFYIFLGPTPEEVTSQYTDVIGRPYFPPYWSLGFQLCRYGYGSLDNLKEVFERNIGKIPYEIQYSDIDYMERQLDFTINNETYYGLEDFVREVKADHNMKYIIIFDPAISGNETGYAPFDNGVRDDVFIKTPEGGIAWGKVWPDYPGIYVNTSKDWDYQTENYRAFAAFPDFSLPQTDVWWTNLTVDFHKRIEFDGLWIDMNEPASFVMGSPTGCLNNTYDYPPYVPRLASGNIYDKTLCMRNVQYNPATGGTTQHYNMHSLYGRSQTLPTIHACRNSTGERCIVISRSTYPGSGKYVGHWLGDNTSIWQHLQTSIIGMLEFNLFGIPYIGADVCGFFVDTTIELCRRWMQLGAFYPFDRNHNGIGWADQDPGVFGDEFLQDSKKVLDMRYTLLPYLYTLFYDAHTTGTTVVRPMMNVFPKDRKTYEIDRQFLWGEGILVTPVLEEGKTEVAGYFPSRRWFDYWNGKELSATDDSDGWETLTTPMDHINVHILGGNIIPTQDPALTTTDSRKNPFGLIVALDETGISNGKLFWDDGTSIDTIDNKEYTLIEFSCEYSTLTNSVKRTNQAPNSMPLSTIRVLGITRKVTRVVVDGNEHSNFTDDTNTKELTIKGLPIFMDSNFEIRWEIDGNWKKIDCMPSLATNSNKYDCEMRGCEWDDNDKDVVKSPKCYYKTDAAPSYQLQTTRTASGTYTLTRNTGVGQRYGTPVENLNLIIEHQTDNRLHFKLKNVDNSSFEIPPGMHDFSTSISSDEANALYSVEVMEDPFGIVVKRKLTGKVLFDSSVGPLVYEEKYLEISTSLPSDLVFGLGEHNHRRYRHDFNGRRWGIFTRDVAPIDGWNFYGHQTFYMAVDDVDTGSAVGVYLHNSNAMDVEFSPDPLLTYRIVGGVLDFYIFVGDSQEQVVQQYHQLIGKPMMPPYWGLGFQLSRWGYKSLDEVKQVYSETRAAGIPYDVQYGDIDYMDEYKSFTYNKTAYDGLPEFVHELHENGMRYVIIIDPGIKIEAGYKAYDEGITDDIFIKNPEGQPLVTEVWPGETHHPDFTHPNVTEWWTDQCGDFYSNQNVTYDALWIDMNEPANFQPDNPDKLKEMNCSTEFNNPPYMPYILGYDVGLHQKTICMENVQYEGLHYDLHSLYGHTMSVVTYDTLTKIMPNRRSFVVTRSNFAGTGKYAGHWLGDNQSQWRQMPWAIPAMFEFNLFGFAWIGADICGFWYDTDAEMCQRWMQVGAFYPFSRNHNAEPFRPQHPSAFGDEVTDSSRDVLQIRYEILPYMYTLHYQANKNGGTVVRALVHEFPSDRNTWDADRQFLLGSGFLITPVMEQGAVSVIGYFPADARWYDYRTGKELTTTGQFVTLDAPLDYINLHVRGGTIIPRQNHNVTTTLARKNPMSLLVPLDNQFEATGTFYWDDGESRNVGETFLEVEFSCSENVLNITVPHPIAGGLDVSLLHFEKIVVYGLAQSNIAEVNVDEEPPFLDGSGEEPVEFMYDNVNHVLEIMNLTLSINSPHSVMWT